MYTLLIVLVVLVVLSSLPVWPYSRGWGYRPSSLLTLVLLIVILFALLGRT